MARFARSTLPSVDYVEELAARAAGGDDTAITQLGDLNYKISRMMNERMRKMEKAGETGDAYNRITDMIGSTRFSTSRGKDGNIEGMYDNLRNAMRAAGYKESTLGGIAEVKQETATSLFQHFGIKGPGQEATKAEAARLSDFFKSDYWKKNRRSFASDDLSNLSEVVVAGGEEYAALMESIQSWDASDPFGAVEEWLEF